ncbi:hypothetical protein [Acinetobacter baumannii]|uniref:hypothetical protein n=1 Tax=Acinetobacter baumannii TaxID=470 RepID=UPI0022B57B53|nr:hypothetical protein [Acinetobacter baumannii]
MDNYKIKVKDEAESKEAQELFVQLGYELFKSKRIGIVATEDNGTVYPDVIGNWDAYEGKELTLPQLRDLVVLKRNDVKDANHHAERGGEYFITSDGDIYFWMCKWVKSTLGSAESLTATETSQPQDPALISGAEAELVAQAKKFITSDHLNRFEAAEAHLEGHPVQFMLANGDFIDITSDTTLGIFEKDGGYSFRLKPQTIKVELELPKPFEPKVGDIYWFLSPFYSTGYDHCTFANDSSDKLHVQYGAYRSEDDVKKAVEQLRKIRGTNS